MNDATKKISKDELEIEFSIDDDLKIDNGKEKSPTEDRKNSVTQTGIELASDDSNFSLDLDLDLNGQVNSATPSGTISMLRSTSVSSMIENAAQSSSDPLAKEENSTEIKKRENTQKTIIIDQKQLEDLEIDSNSLELGGPDIENDLNDKTRVQQDASQGVELGLMSTEKSNDDIKSTIVDILGVKKPEGTETALDQGIINSEHDKLLKDFHDDEATRFLSNETLTSRKLSGTFDLDSVQLFELESETAPAKNIQNNQEKTILKTNIEGDAGKKSSLVLENINEHEEKGNISNEKKSLNAFSAEESLHVQSTLRALREDREGLLLQIKKLKDECRDAQEEGLVLRASLDEAMLEIGIIRKSKQNEFEELKYKLNLSEEKRIFLEEKLKSSESKRQKMEQTLKIDFNHLKSREKELESKLELLTMDIESQVHGREQKILELRRKIDLLEFSMENASIKEQKSIEDKRKLEERLMKLTKILKHSLKNIEEDIDFSLESLELHESQKENKR